MLVIGVHHFAQKKHGNEVTMKRFIITGIILLFTLTTIVFLHPAKPQHESIDNTTNSYEYYYNEKKDEEEEDSLLPEDLDSILAENPTAPLDLVPSSITVLVNRTYLLPSSYTPANLVIPDVKFSFSYISDKRKLRKVAANALEKLFEAAEKEDIELYGVSGYRSYARQKEIYDRNIAVRGQAATDAVSAKPGSSEHQTGLTIDVSSKSVNYRLDQSFGDTKEGKWQTMPIYMALSFGIPMGNRILPAIAMNPGTSALSALPLPPISLRRTLHLKNIMGHNPTTTHRKMLWM